MAKVTITIEDNEKTNRIDITQVFAPTLQAHESHTTAQLYGLYVPSCKNCSALHGVLLHAVVPYSYTLYTCLCFCC
jgi:hypothetical protein